MAKKATTTIDGDAVAWDFASGKRIEVHLSELPEDIVTQLALHGLRQKGSDAYAGVSDPDESAAATQRVVDQLKSGTWRATSGGSSGPRVTMLAEALARLARKAGKEITVEKAVEIVEALPDEAEDGQPSKKVLRADPGIKAEMAAIRLERAQKEAETSESSLAGLL